MKKGGSSKSSKQQAAIAMSMKAAGKKPKKMAMGGSLKPVDSSKNPGLAKLPTAVRNKMGYKKMGGVQGTTPIKKGGSGSGITGVRKAVFNEAKSNWGEKPNTQWSYDQMSKWKSDVAKKPNYKKGGAVKRNK